MAQTHCRRQQPRRELHVPGAVDRRGHKSSRARGLVEADRGGRAWEDSGFEEHGEWNGDSAEGVGGGGDESDA